MMLTGPTTIILSLFLWNSVTSCHGKEQLVNRDPGDDLEFSDTSHGEVTNTDQQVLFINHGGGAVSSVRRNQLQAPFAPHVNAYPNSLFDGNNFAEVPFVGYPGGDVPRLFQRRAGDDQQYHGHHRQPNLAEHQVPVPTPPPPPLPLPLPLAQPLPFGAPLPSHPVNNNQNHLNQVNPLVNLQHHQRPPPPPPPPQPVNVNPFLDNPVRGDFFNFFDNPFAPPPPSAPSPHLFQRRRLTLGNNLQDFQHNSIGVGYPSYTYYKGGEEDAAVKWPKIFKFTDGRINLSDFEKDKKLGKVKFSKKDPDFDNIRRDSFLILHGGTYS